MAIEDKEVRDRTAVKPIVDAFGGTDLDGRWHFQYIQGHPRLGNGFGVYTSSVVWTKAFPEEKLTVIETRNTIYFLWEEKNGSEFEFDAEATQKLTEGS